MLFRVATITTRHTDPTKSGKDLADRPSICPSFSSREEGTRCFTLNEVVQQPRIVLQPRRASPTNHDLNLRSRCRGIEPRAPRAPQLPADTRRFRRRRRNLDFVLRRAPAPAASFAALSCLVAAVSQSRFRNGFCAQSLFVRELCRSLKHVSLSECRSPFCGARSATQQLTPLPHGRGFGGVPQFRAAGD